MNRTIDSISEPLLGPAATDLGWVPAPRYLLRRRRILKLLRGTSPCDAVEIGSGAGMLLQELTARGFSCTALETSPQARSIIETVSKRIGHRLEVQEEPQTTWPSHFRLVMAFEVLEHIEDDARAFAQWATWLAPGGTLLLSVPAHPRQWNAADVWAGHYRRYRKKDLVRLVRDAGLELEHVECIGFPLGNLSERMQARGFEREVRRTGQAGQRETNNDRSGVDRTHVLRLYPFMKSRLGHLVLHVAFALQAMTTRVGLGNGYLIKASKPA